MVKMTFTLDDATVDAIRRIADRRGKPQSVVVREAIAAYARQEPKLDPDERTRRVRVLDAIAAQPPTRSRAAVDDEMAAVRRARRTGWRRPSD